MADARWLNRRAGDAGGGILSFDGFTIDLAGRSLRDGNGSEVPLTRSEFTLLVVLARHAGRVLSRDQLRDADARPSGGAL